MATSTISPAAALCGSMFTAVVLMVGTILYDRPPKSLTPRGNAGSGRRGTGILAVYFMNWEPMSRKLC